MNSLQTGPFILLKPMLQKDQVINTAIGETTHENPDQ